MGFNLIRRRFIAVVGVFIGVLLLGWWIIRPLWLTEVYGPELAHAVQRYREVLGTVEGWRDLAVIAQVATGDYLDYLAQVRCVDCASVQVATKIGVQVLRVLEYSATTSTAITRIEWGWHKVDPDTGAVLGACHAQAFTDLYVLTWSDGTWKVSGGEEIDANRVDDSPDLLADYCSSN